MLSEYLTVAKASEIVLIERKSRFIGRAHPASSVAEAEEFIKEISKNTGMPPIMYMPIPLESTPSSKNAMMTESQAGLPDYRPWKRSKH